MSSKTKRKPNDPEKRKQYQDALGLLTDDHLRAELTKRREVLRERLAALVVDKMMPGYVETDDHKAAEAMFVAAIEEVDGRLKGASKWLRAFGSNGHSEDTEPE